MIGTKCFFPYRQRPLVQRLGIGIATLGSDTELARLFSDARNIGMIGTDHLFLNRQRSLVQRFGISVTTLVVVKRSQIVQWRGNVGVIGTTRIRSSSM